ATDAFGRLPNLLHRGKQQGDQDANDGDHHQQLDQRETYAPVQTSKHVDDSFSSSRRNDTRRAWAGWWPFLLRATYARAEGNRVNQVSPNLQEGRAVRLLSRRILDSFLKYSQSPTRLSLPPGRSICQGRSIRQCWCCPGPPSGINVRRF